MLAKLRIIMDEGNFTVRQVATLVFLHEHGTMRHREIAIQLGFANAVVNRIVDKLSIEGLAEREREDRDRRQCLISITAYGRKFVQSIL